MEKQDSQRGADVSAATRGTGVPSLQRGETVEGGDALLMPNTQINSEIRGYPAWISAPFPNKCCHQTQLSPPSQQ